MKTSKRNFDYPEKTVGSELARQIRKEANSLTPKERRRHLQAGMKKINEGERKK